jgi:hypothetical protein
LVWSSVKAAAAAAAATEFIKSCKARCVSGGRSWQPSPVPGHGWHLLDRCGLSMNAAAAAAAEVVAVAAAVTAAQQWWR